MREVGLPLLGLAFLISALPVLLIAAPESAPWWGAAGALVVVCAGLSCYVAVSAYRTFANPSPRVVGAIAAGAIPAAGATLFVGLSLGHPAWVFGSLCVIACAFLALGCADPARSWRR